MKLSELFSKYKSITKIKKGGQKTVYKASLLNGDVVALKIISNANDQRILQEIEIVQTIGINNIPKIIESGTVLDDNTDEESLYIVEEYIEGISLRDWIDLGNRFNLSKSFDLTLTLITIETQLENKQILHRDINPNNILLGTDGKIYLIDFGIAKFIGGRSLTSPSAPSSPFTPGYAPLEQFGGHRMHQDVRTDLFEIGVTIYESCCGNNPFFKQGDSLDKIINQTISTIPPSLVLMGDSKGLFAQFIGMLMAKNPSQRPNTAQDALRYLIAIKSSLELEETA